MRYLSLCAIAAVVGQVAAHAGIPSLPNLLTGREALEEAGVQQRDGFERRFRAPKDDEAMEKRQVSTDGRCGSNFGTVCSSDECCSSAGWCGTGYIYCSAPSCQIEYGPACDANLRPSGPNTEDTPRPKVGPVPYGQAIYHCERYGDIALSYDDGPYTYTEDLLDLLKEYKAKATFYITGRNLGKGAINDPATPWPGLIKRMVAEGHQVASHTWSHQRLTTLSQAKFRNQMIFNEIAIADVLGYFPTYMRPPYSASNATTDGWLNDLGYHITYFNLDTEGYLHDSPNLIQASKDIWDKAVEGADTATTKWLQIEHDPVYQSVYNLTEHMLKSLFDNDFRSVTVGECLGDPEENWYRSVRGGSAPSPTTTTTGRDPTGTSTGSSSTATGSFPPTTNGRCGFGQGDQSCNSEPSDKCCSQKGWCGATEDHCGRGCQPLFGSCNDFRAPGTSSTSSRTPQKGSSSSTPSSASPATSLSTRTLTAPTTTRSCSQGTTTKQQAASTATTIAYTKPTQNPLISKDGRCGPKFGDTTCIEEPGATCCSTHGWCGNTVDHCGKDCQPLFGTCGKSKE